MRTFVVLGLVALSAPALADDACTTSAECGARHCIDGRCRSVGPTAGDAEDDVTVHVAGDTGAVLQRSADEMGPWTTLCASPCVSLGSRADFYRVVGRATSPPIRPTVREPDDVWLHAQLGAPAPAMLALGIAGSTLAVAGNTMGFVALFASLGTYGSLCNDPTGCPVAPSWRDPLAAAGVAVGVVGIVTGVVAFVLFAATHRTALSQTPRPTRPIVMPARIAGPTFSF